MPLTDTAPADGRHQAPGTLTYLAGLESGMAAWISDTTPERVASRLQEVAR